MTEDEETERPLHEKVSSLVDSLLASGLNEPALLKRIESIRRPQNCKLLRRTKKSTRRSRILLKNIIPIARLMETTGDALEKGGAMPSPDEPWKGLFNSVLLKASATHELKMCRQDLLSRFG